MRKILILLLFSACAFAQGIGGAGGIGGTGGFGGGAAAGAPTTVTYANLTALWGGLSINETANPGSTPTTGSAVVGIIAILNQASTLVSICDGTGTDGCTGSSTYTIEPVYHNGTSFDTYVFFTCNYVGTGTTGSVIATQTGAQGMYGMFVVATGNTTTGTNCLDGYNKAQSTASATTWTSGTITTTNANDLLVGLFTATSGSTNTATPGQDGQGHTYTSRGDSVAVIFTETLSASATNTYSAAASGASSPWNAMVIAIK